MNILPTYASERLEICGSCDEYNSSLKTCGLCGCIMPAKVLIKQTHCPAEKWTKLDANEPMHNESFFNLLRKKS